MIVSRFYSTSFFLICSFGYTVLHPFSLGRVTRFESNIAVNKDASLLVQEVITVVNAGAFKRGITRTFPTRYELPGGFIANTSFEVRNVRLNGNAVKFHVENHANGKRMYIGDPATRLAPGTHTYTIAYKTTRQLGFFERYDELYWNVTGNDTALPIEHVIARVTLPAQIPIDAIKAEGYTGYFGQRYQNYTASVQSDGTVVFESTRELSPHEGLTIVVTWPKGFVTEPSRVMRAWYFMQDNWGIWVLLVGIIGVLLWYLWAYYYVRRNIKEGTVIPLFYPPQKLLPGALRYIMHKGYDSGVTSADIVNMAVMGALTISYEKKFFGGSRYTLLKKERPDARSSLYATVYDVLFMSHDKVVLESSYAATVEQVITNLKTYYYNQFGSSLFKSNMEYLLVGVLIGAFAIGIAVVATVSWLWLVPGGIVLLIIIFYFAHRLAIYTQEGQKLKEDIEGFKLFLGTTETERLKIIGTPPTRTPELYETYLPYAIALGVEDRWTKQFTPVFARLEQQGQAYVPVWYVGPGRFNAMHMGNLSSGLSNSISYATISASTSVPGSSSGSGGGGSSGGGGGGGGVGGW